eukprot:2625386-Rhodomonas_salina.1
MHADTVGLDKKHRERLRRMKEQMRECCARGERVCGGREEGERRGERERGREGGDREGEGGRERGRVQHGVKSTAR